ncbi:MAG TPA: hypothetical protein ENJ82_18215 [Bacteroidetes bacterium]|nr:hypothetical protein [Bacteroidota bacterium]
MRIFSFFLLITLGLSYGLKAQVDVSTSIANPKTFIFDDEKHTVHGYIYNMLKSKTACCGNDAIYLEVKFDNTGSVTSAKTLTGKNDCYKKSVVDIVKSVRWDATGVTGTKTIYFEVKPIVPCSGSPGENTYKKIAGMNSAAVAAVNETKSEVSNVVTKVEETAVVKDELLDEDEDLMDEELVSDEDEAFAEETPVKVVEKKVEEKVEEVVSNTSDEWASDSFLSDDGKEESETPTITKADVKASTGVVSGKDAIKNRNESSTTKMITSTGPAKAYTGPVKIPPQEKLEYVSKGERSPDKSHNTTFVNVPVQSLAPPTYVDGDGQFGLQLRKGLRKSGFCGLAQAALEIEIAPNGQVVNTRILAANNDRVKEVVPGIISGLRFKPQGIGQNYRSYQQFKAEIVCEGQSPTVNLEEVPDIIKQ